MLFGSCKTGTTTSSATGFAGVEGEEAEEDETRYITDLAQRSDNQAEVHPQREPAELLAPCVDLAVYAHTHASYDRHASSSLSSTTTAG